jgi:hypothetical protein
MQKVSEYRHHAEECRTLARRARSAADRDMLLKMADSWDELARAREKRMVDEKPKE